MYKSIKRKTRAKRGTKRAILKRGAKRVVKRSYRKNKRGGGSRRKTKNVKRRGSKRTKRTRRRRRRVLRGGEINDGATVKIDMSKWNDLDEKDDFIKNLEWNSGTNRPGKKCQQTITIDNIKYGYNIYSKNNDKDTVMINLIKNVLPDGTNINTNGYVLVKFPFTSTIITGARKINDNIKNIKFNLEYNGPLTYETNDGLGDYDYNNTVFTQGIPAEAQSTEV